MENGRQDGAARTAGVALKYALKTNTDYFSGQFKFTAPESRLLQEAPALTATTTTTKSPEVNWDRGASIRLIEWEPRLWRRRRRLRLFCTEFEATFTLVRGRSDASAAAAAFDCSGAGPLLGKEALVCAREISAHRRGWTFGSCWASAERADGRL